MSVKRPRLRNPDIQRLGLETLELRTANGVIDREE